MSMSLHRVNNGTQTQPSVGTQTEPFVPQELSSEEMTARVATRITARKLAQLEDRAWCMMITGGTELYCAAVGALAAWTPGTIALLGGAGLLTCALGGQKCMEARRLNERVSVSIDKLSEPVAVSIAKMD